MFNGRHARTSVKALIATLVASIISLLPAVPANAAIPATESDEVGMVDGLVRAIVVSGNQVWVGGSFSEMRDANGTKVQAAAEPGRLRRRLRSTDHVHRRARGHEVRNSGNRLRPLARS